MADGLVAHLDGRDHTNFSRFQLAVATPVSSHSNVGNAVSPPLTGQNGTANSNLTVGNGNGGGVTNGDRTQSPHKYNASTTGAVSPTTGMIAHPFAPHTSAIIPGTGSIHNRQNNHDGNGSNGTGSIHHAAHHSIGGAASETKVATRADVFSAGGDARSSSSTSVSVAPGAHTNNNGHGHGSSVPLATIRNGSPSPPPAGRTILPGSPAINGVSHTNGSSTPTGRGAMGLSPARSGATAGGGNATHTPAAPSTGGEFKVRPLNLPPPQQLKAPPGKKTYAYPVFDQKGDFEIDYQRHQLHQLRTKVIQRVVLFTLFFILLEINYIVVPSYDINSSWPAILVRLLVASLLLTWCGVLWRVKLIIPSQNQHNTAPPSIPWIRQHQETSLAVLMTIAGAALIWLELARDTSELTNDTRDGVLLGVLLVYVFAFVLLRLPWPHCFIMSVVLFGCFTISHLVDGRDHTYLIFADLLQLVVLASLFVVAREDESFRVTAAAQTKALEVERRQKETLLRSMLPPQIIVDYLGGHVRHLSATATIGFVNLYIGAKKPTNPYTDNELIQKLHDMFKRIDEIVGLYSIRGVSKIETVSKTYLLCSGLLDSSIEDHAAAMIDVSLEILHMVQKSFGGKNQRIPVVLRIGVATGQVVGGIIGTKRRYFRVFGDTVNVAARMCTNSQEWEIQMSEAVYRSLDEHKRAQYRMPPPRVLQIKGKGEMKCWVAPLRDGWVPQFGKSTVMHGAVGPATKEPELSKFFVYQKMMEATTINRATLEYQSEDKSQVAQIDASFQQWWATKFLSTFRIVHIIAAIWMLGALIYFAATPDDNYHDAALILSIIALVLLVLPLSLSLLQVFQRHMQTILALFGFLIGTWVIVGLCIYDIRGPLAPAFALCTSLIYLLIFLRLHVHYSRVLATITFVAFLIALAVKGVDSVPWYDMLMVLSNNAMMLACVMLSATQFEHRLRRTHLTQYALERDSEQVQKFLDNLLPAFVLEIVMRKGPSAQQVTNGDIGSSSRFAKLFPQCTVFESDIVGYTAMVSSWKAESVLDLLNKIFSGFDDTAAACGVEKIETIGDAFIVVLFDGAPDPVLNFATGALKVIAQTNQETKNNLNIRVGIATGSCFGAVIGDKIPRFHLFGESHDTSIHIEQNGVPGQIIVGAPTYELSKARWEYRAIPGLIVDDFACYQLIGPLEHATLPSPTSITPSTPARRQSVAAAASSHASPAPPRH